MKQLVSEDKLQEIDTHISAHSLEHWQEKQIKIALVLDEVNDKI